MEDHIRLALIGIRAVNTSLHNSIKYSLSEAESKWLTKLCGRLTRAESHLDLALKEIDDDNIG